MQCVVQNREPYHRSDAISFNSNGQLNAHICMQASTQGLVRELKRHDLVKGQRVLCPVPLVTGGLTEPIVVPKFLAALQVPTSILQTTALPCTNSIDLFI